MPTGPGKYDEICESALHITGADAVVMIVVSGTRGSGMSMSIQPHNTQFEAAVLSEEMARRLPDMLRITADEIESSMSPTPGPVPDA